MSDQDLLFTPATDLAAAIRSKNISPVEVMDAVLDRVHALQPSLNAFITITDETAQKQAKEAEAAVMAGGDLGPLHGVPFTVKDLTFTKGVRTTMGSFIHADFVPDEDAVPVARLKDAGAILIGKTTTPEYGHGPITQSPLFGVTPSPWDAERTCGGSSGGAGVAVATGMGPVALGTDGGGSVRIPASCCGLVGLKATLGAIPHIHALDTFGNNSFIGPMTRTVGDARLMFDVIGGPHAGDAFALAEPPVFQALPDGDLSGVRIAWLPKAGDHAVDGEVATSTAATVAALADMGAEVETVEIDLRAEEDLFLVVMQSGLRARLLPHVDEFKDRLSDALLKTIELGGRWSAADLFDVAIRRTRMFHDMQAVFEDFDFLVSPTLSAPPMAADLDIYSDITIDNVTDGPIRGVWYPFTYPFNLTGHPALSIPCGWTDGGLPMGFQIVGPWHAEGRMLDLAARIENVRPWADRRPPV
jgi:aspartyl-tRNA(Asn)/glutamyl-tRNA(Gln) amidotransferase subunit A